MVNEPGAGSAGGLGFACLWLGATRVSGADYFLDTLEFDAQAQAHDVVITGEGRLDEQSLHGKLPSVVVRRAGQLPVHLIVGAVELDDTRLATLGVGSVAAISERARRDTRENSELSFALLRDTARELGERLTAHATVQQTG